MRMPLWWYLAGLLLIAFCLGMATFFSVTKDPVLGVVACLLLGGVAALTVKDMVADWIGGRCL